VCVFLLWQSAFAEPGTELLPLGREQAGDDEPDLRVLAARLSQPASPGAPAQLLPRQAAVRRVRLSVPVERQARVGPDGVALPVSAARPVETNATLLSRRQYCIDARIPRRRLAPTRLHSYVHTRDFLASEDVGVVECDTDTDTDTAYARSDTILQYL